MKRVVSLVKERWAYENEPAKPQVDLKVGKEFDLGDDLAELLVSLGKAEYVIEEEIEEEPNQVEPSPVDVPVVSPVETKPVEEVPVEAKAEAKVEENKPNRPWMKRN